MTKRNNLWHQACKLIMVILIVLVIFGWLMLLVGCKSKESVVQTQIVHDSVFVARDSVVYRLVKDSVIERQQTTSTANGDTIFIDRLREVERWKIRTDTVKLVQYLKEKSDSTSQRDAVRVEKQPSVWKPPNFTVLAIWVVAVCAIVYLIRARQDR